MRKTIFWMVVMFAAVGLTFTGCEQKQEEKDEEAAEEGGEGTEEGESEGTGEASDIVAVAKAAGDFEMLLAAADAAGLVETLTGEGPYTVFAPTDAAFEKLPDGKVDELLKPENKEQLAAILTYHVVPGKVMAADVAGMESADTVQGGALTIKTEGDAVMINNATVAKADVEASNGVIHVIDTVLIPAEGDTEGGGTIVDVAKEAGSFSTLLAAAEAAGLVETLSGEGPFTVFAPTDEAFGKLPEGTVETLLKPENKEQLASLLTYHVVPGKVMAADVAGMESAKTVQGAELTISTQGDAVKVNDATVKKTDIEASNGVIHVIDAVVMPPE